MGLLPKSESCERPVRKRWEEQSVLLGWKRILIPGCDEKDGSPCPLSSACSASLLQMPRQAIHGLLAKEVNGSLECCYIIISL
ncbi:MAG: hypothetical protein MH321_04925 [Leptospiraceae bacterium]|nr:hypothetical protein [Leptospiraceae bacterium]